MGNKLFIGNLPFSVTNEGLEEYFRQAGNVTSAKVITDKATGRSKGFGFVEMASDAEATDAIAKLNGQNLGGRPISVAEAKPREEGAGGGRGGFGGPRGGGAGRGGFGGSRGPRY